MKARLLLLLALTSAVKADDPKRLNVSVQFEAHGDRIYLIEDLETKTRCYAITDQKMNISGYAISCVKY